MTKPAQLREKSSEQLQFDLDEVQQRLFQLRCTAATDKLDKPSDVRMLKREIARLHTILRERELASLYEKLEQMLAEAEAEEAAAAAAN